MSIWKTGHEFQGMASVAGVTALRTDLPGEFFKLKWCLQKIAAAPVHDLLAGLLMM
jgi:hypothetical protein